MVKGCYYLTVSYFVVVNLPGLRKLQLYYFKTKNKKCLKRDRIVAVNQDYDFPGNCQKYLRKLTN